MIIVKNGNILDPTELNPIGPRKLVSHSVRYHVPKRCELPTKTVT